jgi:rRNA maturation endonuclease Nob1
MNWAQLLKRVFDIDIERCPICGSALKIIAAPSTRCCSGQA